MSIETCVCVGALGGSGTRLVASILDSSGVYIGSDLNEANDNLWYTLLFKDRRVLYEDDFNFSKRVDHFVAAMKADPEFAPDLEWLDELTQQDRPQHPIGWLKKRLAIYHAREVLASPRKIWGWKEPNTHICVHKIKRKLPHLKYIHVVRHGLDMAFSNNKNQLDFWGDYLLGRSVENTLSDSLKYWIRVDKLTRKKLQYFSKGDFLIIKFEDLCFEPDRTIISILEFIGAAVNKGKVSELASMVKTPASINRYKQFDISVFDAEDINYLKRIGYEVEL